MMGTVVRISRLKNSINGNPRFVLHMKDGSNFQTPPDSSYAYDVKNMVGHLPMQVHYTLDGRGRLISIAKVTG